jgi:hypothetical protein
MAILDSCPGIEVTICSKGESIPEYDDPNVSREENGQDNTVTKYVESRPGADFSLRYRDSPPFRHRSHQISFIPFLDGHGTPGASCTAAQFEFERRYEKDQEGHVFTDKHGGIFRKFAFATLRISIDHFNSSSRLLLITRVTPGDKDSIPSTRDKSLEMLGEIVVKVFEMNEGTLIELDQKDYSPQVEVSEKALKGRAISMSVA